jgi:hypothetical protein
MTTRTSGLTRLTLGLVILAALLACKKKRDPLSFIADPPIADGRNYTLTIGTAKECDTGKKHFAPKQGFVHLAVEVTFESKSDGLSFHAYPMQLKAPDGQSYGTSLGQCEPELPLPFALKKGERRHGFLTFEIPENSTSFLLSYENRASPAEDADAVAIILKL